MVDDETESLQELAYYTTGYINEVCLNELATLHPAINVAFNKVVVCYDFPVALHLGDKKTGFQGSGSNLFIQNGYGVPSSVHQWLSNKFKQATFIQQGDILNSIEGWAATNSLLLVDFRENDFFVLAVNNKEVILKQVYEYSTPADVLFYLLKICTTFSITQNEANLQLSGLIDKDSALYKELYQYFINISFREASWKAPANEYPAHFFTSLNDLVLCGL